MFKLNQGHKCLNAFMLIATPQLTAPQAHEFNLTWPLCDFLHLFI